MKKNHFCQVAALLALLNCSVLNAYAWNHSIELGYGISHDPNHTKYDSSGFLLTSDLFPVWRNAWTFWSITGALGQWHNTAPDNNQNLTTVAVSIALRLYLYDFACKYPSYLLGSVGPAYLSSKWFGFNEQAGQLTFQWNAGLGVELNHLDLNFRLVHFSNAYLAQPDHGFTILYMLSLGYLF